MASNNRESRKESLERELAELMDVKSLVEGELFQKYFATPFYKEDKELKAAYDCLTLEELQFTGGLHKGLSKLARTVDEVESRLRFIKDELGKS